MLSGLGLTELGFELELFSLLVVDGSRVREEERAQKKTAEVAGERIM